MDKYGLIGYPLGHSFSKGYFNEKFENEGIDAQYINFEIPSIEDLTEILDSNPELKGLNVTIPYKEKVISYLDQVSPEANAIGAVNVVKVEHKGDETILKGYNSDVIGFTQSIEPFIESFHKKALILGTGGASKAINYGLKEIGGLLGVDDLEYYAARHSWATIALNKVGIDKYTVHAALNHVDESMRVTDIYIERDFVNENKANAKVIKYVFGK